MPIVNMQNQFDVFFAFIKTKIAKIKSFRPNSRFKKKIPNLNFIHMRFHDKGIS